MYWCNRVGLVGEVGGRSGLGERGARPLLPGAYESRHAVNVVRRLPLGQQAATSYCLARRPLVRSATGYVEGSGACDARAEGRDETPRRRSGVPLRRVAGIRLRVSHPCVRLPRTARGNATGDVTIMQTRGRAPSSLDSTFA
jgi:hypothetical protein